MSPPKIRVQGIRTPIPQGYMLGRVSRGKGPVELLDPRIALRQMRIGGGGTADIQVLLDGLGDDRGDILFRAAAQWTVLPASTANFILRTGGPSGDPSWAGISTIIDTLGSTRGQILYRNATAWVPLNPGTSGFLLQTGGAGADPSWTSASGVGAVSSVFGRTGAVVAQTGDYTYSQISGTPTLAAVATSGSASDLGTGTLPDARLSNTITAGGPTGDATHVAQVTYDAHGRLTTVSSVAITFPASAVTSVFGRTGAVVSATNDYNFNQLAGSVAASQMPALTGDVTSSAGTVLTTIATNAVTLAKFQQIATTTILGRTTAGTGNVEVLTASQARGVIGVTASGADTTYAFRANNLSDLTNTATARTNLGLVTIANTGSASDLSSGTVADARLSANIPLLNADNIFTKTMSLQSTTNAQLTVIGDGVATSLQLQRFIGNTAGPANTMFKARGSVSIPAAVQQNDEIGILNYRGYTGAAFAQGIRIQGNMSAATPSATDMETRLVYSLIPAASVTLTEMMRFQYSVGMMMYGTNVVIDNNRKHVNVAGTVGAPSTYFTGDSNTGFYSPAADTFGVVTGGIEGLRVTSSQNVHGTALHNNSTAPTGVTNQYVASGTYTPTLTNVANLDSSTAYVCQWIRVGNVVTVSGRVTVDPTTVTTPTQLGMSLPIASALTAPEQLGGAAGSVATTGVERAAGIRADATNDRAEFVWISAQVNAIDYNFSFTYLLL